ncbi:MAG: LytTR family transcriptional regulator [Myxococcaceae bacterium]|nr:LytTR family transcriptional regulator [Myxococcaceae bacterium]
MDEIDWVEAADDDVEIHAGGKSYLHREAMQSLEARSYRERFQNLG